MLKQRNFKFNIIFYDLTDLRLSMYSKSHHIKGWKCVDYGPEKPDVYVFRNA